MKKLSNKLIIIISFSIFFGWMMAFPYEGPVMYALLGNQSINTSLLNYLSLLSLGSGLFVGRYVTKDSMSSKKVIIFLISLAILFSVSIPFIDISLWVYLLPIVSFIAAISLISFAYPIHNFTFNKERTLIAADLLIYGNLFLFIAHMLAISTEPVLAFGFIELVLITALLAMTHFDTQEKREYTLLPPKEVLVALHQFWPFFLSLFVMTLIARVVNSAIYLHLSNFSISTNFLALFSYIIAILLLSRIIKVKKFSFFYIGLFLWTIAFILSTLPGQTSISFIIICSLIFFSYGLFDFFWFSTLLESLELVKSPASFLGLGLSVKVLALGLGTLFSHLITTFSNSKVATIMDILLVMIAFSIILPLSFKLSRLIIQNKNLLLTIPKESTFQDNPFEDVKNQLSKREFEVFELLIAKHTDKEICTILNLAKSTIKTHDRNIYRKLEVSGRTELHKKYSSF